MDCTFVLLPGDGIGPEVIKQAERVLESVAVRFVHKFTMIYALAGGAAIDACGQPLPEETLELCLNSKAVLLGALGGDAWDCLPAARRPESGLLRLRKEMGVYANLRPIRLFPQLIFATPLKAAFKDATPDIVIVRELTGGIYFGKRGRGADYAYDTEYYTREEIRRVAVMAFDLAAKRRRKLTLVDKANVLESSRLWRETVKEMSADYKAVELNFLYVDNAAMQLIVNPLQFDVILTSNMFGDILSDEAAVLSGSIGMLPSASLGDGAVGLYEPAHGAAPDLAGANKANPLAAILSAAMMLRHSFALEREADLIERSVEEVLNSGLRTADIWEEGKILATTEEMGIAAAENALYLPIT
jgi:3-isopropylmalate dehydrogenase